MRISDTICRLVLLCVLVGACAPFAAAQGFSIPSILEAGSSVVIEGPFDGDSSNAQIIIGESILRPESETVGSCSFVVPSDLLGRQTIALEESGDRSEAEVVILQIRPTLERTNLSRGEMTQLRLEVRGVDALDSPVDLIVRNESPQQINIDGGNSVGIVISPGRDTTVAIQIKAKQSGNFEISYELAKDGPREQFTDAGDADSAEADSTKQSDCGAIKGKVINKAEFTFKGIVVHVVGKCEICEPKPPCPSTTVEFGDSGAQPSFIVIPAGCPITLKNVYEKQVNELPRIIPNPVAEKPRTLDIDVLARGDSTSITPIRSGRYLIDSDIHTLTDGYMFVAASSCYSITDSAGHYYIGELPPGVYELEVFTHPKRTEFPKATVTVKANEVTTQDFILER